MVQKRSVSKASKAPKKKAPSQRQGVRRPSDSTKQVARYKTYVSVPKNLIGVGNVYLNTHDSIIQLVCNKVIKKGYALCNPNNAHNFPLETPNGILYPDIIVASGTGKAEVLELYEVKTKNDFGSRSIAQFLEYNKLGIAWFLVVPKEALDIVKGIKKQHKLKCKILTYWFDKGWLFSLGSGWKIS
jgi:hypothetical protein